MGRVNHQTGKKLFFISFLFLTIFVLSVSPVSALEEVMDKDCTIKDEVFDRDWKRYSDLENTPLTFEERPLTARFPEIQRYYATQSEIVDAELQIFFLKRDMEIDRLIRLELKEYKKALVSGHRKNLLKSFCRLSFLTVHTMYEAREVGKSLFGKPASPGGAYGNLFTAPSLLSATGSALKIINTYKAMAPAESSALANNSQGIIKVLDDATLNIALETVESLGDPKKIAVEVINQIMKAAPIPTSANEWKLTEDDFNILRAEHLKNKELDKTIAKSYRVNLERNNKVKELEIRIKGLKIELAEREANEKSRVKDFLVDNCKNREEGEEEEPEDEECDSEHLCLCDNENDCMTAGGYWYDDQCNNLKEDTSAGEFNCTIPAGAEHIVTELGEGWYIADSKTKKERYVGPYRMWYDKEKTKKESFICRDAEGRTQGISIGWYEDGTLKSELYYKDGKIEGVRRQWYKDGLLRSEYNYKDGKKDGVYRKFHKRTETLYMEYNYKDGKKGGVYKEWHIGGTLVIEGNYKDDKKEGVWKKWHRDGTFRSECIYENGIEVECK